MEMSKLKEGGRSVRIVPGPNGIGFDNGDQVKFMGAESSHNHKNVTCNENYRAPARDISFNSYLMGSDAEQISNTALKAGNAADSQTKGEATAASMEGGDTSRPAFVKGFLEKQNSCTMRVPVIGRITKASEISIFEAEKYFSTQEEKKTDTNPESTTQSSKPRENSNSKDIMQASNNNKVLLSNHDLYDSRHRISSTVPSILVVNRSYRSGGTTPTASSEASWNSQSGLLSRLARNSLNKSATDDRKKVPAKCAFGCKWPCSNKRTVEIDDTVTVFKTTSSVSNSLNTSALMDSPLSSNRYSYPRPGKRALGRSIDKQRSDAFVDNVSESSDLNSSTNAGTSIKTLINPLSIAIDRKLHRNSASYERDSDQQDLGERPDERRITRNSFEKDDFSFPILPVKTRPSLEVFGSPFPGTPHSEDTHKSVMPPHLLQPSDLHKRLVLFSLDKARNSFTFDSNSEAHKFGGNINTQVVDGDEDKESDSSSDLFEIESFITQGTACYPSRRRDCIQSTARELGFQKSFHFGDMEESATLSTQNCGYEPSEASLDWSVTTGDTMGKTSLGNFSTDYEDTKMMNSRASLQSSDLSGTREATMKRRSSTGSFLGCGSERAVSIVPSHRL